MTETQRHTERRSSPPAQTASQPWIRWMMTADEAQVLAIEREAFADHPWTAIDFRVYRERRNHVCWVAEIQSEVCAYVAYELRPKSLAIHNLAVCSELRRNGIGTIIVAALAAKLRPGRRYMLTVEVRETNLVAQLFFKSCGFRAVATIDRPYSPLVQDEDGYLFGFAIDRDKPR